MLTLYAFSCLCVALSFDPKVSMYPVLHLRGLGYCSSHVLQVPWFVIEAKRRMKAPASRSRPQTGVHSMSAWSPGAAASAGRSTVRAAAAAGAAPGHPHAGQARQTGDVSLTPAAQTCFHVPWFWVPSAATCFWLHRHLWVSAVGGSMTSGEACGVQLGVVTVLPSVISA